jgi:hypothetical protein
MGMWRSAEAVFYVTWACGGRLSGRILCDMGMWRSAEWPYFVTCASGGRLSGPHSDDDDDDSAESDSSSCPGAFTTVSLVVSQLQYHICNTVDVCSQV